MAHASIAHTDPTLEDDQDATRAVDPGTRHLDRLGKLLTWLGGLALAVTIVPVTLIGFFAFGIAANGVEPYGPGLLECRGTDVLGSCT